MAEENTNDTASWYDLGFSRGLTEPALLLGVPKLAIVLNAALGGIFIMDFGFWPIIFVNLVIHFASIYVCKSDNQFFDCLQMYMRKKNFYET